MLYVVPFLIIAGLMAISGKLVGNPMAFVGIIYLGVVATLFGMVFLKIIGANP